MAGLALGSFLFGRMADKIEYPVKLYGLLEVGVGLSGLLLIIIFSYLDPLYVKLHLVFGTPGSTNILLKFLLPAIVLLIPTTLLGGTLPLIGKAFANEDHSAGSPSGLLYGVNTFGGVIGAEIARQTIQNAYKYCHLAKISEEELSVATGCDDFEAGVQALLDKGVQLLVISKGNSG